MRTIWNKQHPENLDQHFTKTSKQHDRSTRSFFPLFSTLLLRTLKLQQCLIYQGVEIWNLWAAPREGLGGTVPALLTKVIFVNHLNPMRKKLKVWGRMTSQTIFEFQPVFVASVFQRLDLTNLYFIQLLLLNLFFVFK